MELAPESVMESAPESVMESTPESVMESAPELEPAWSSSSCAYAGPTKDNQVGRIRACSLHHCSCPHSRRSSHLRRNCC